MPALTPCLTHRGRLLLLCFELLAAKEMLENLSVH